MNWRNSFGNFIYNALCRHNGPAQTCTLFVVRPKLFDNSSSITHLILVIIVRAVAFTHYCSWQQEVYARTNKKNYDGRCEQATVSYILSFHFHPPERNHSFPLGNWCDFLLCSQLHVLLFPIWSSRLEKKFV